MKTLLIIDANALIHRSFHALPPFTTPQGEAIGAVYGTAKILLKTLKAFSPNYTAACFDLAEPTFRHQEYKEYKGTRSETPEDLRPQFEKAKRLFKAIGIPCFEKSGFEADDLIGAITKKFDKEKDLKIVIATGDLDTLQLVVDDKIVVYTFKRGMDDVIIYDKQAVLKRYGLLPSQMTDFKGLRGDPSDNIPGVIGIGEKGAIKLLTRFKTLENIYESIEKPDFQPDKEITARIITKLKEQKEQAVFSKYLATIRTDIEIDSDLNGLKLESLDFKKLTPLFEEWGFKTLLAKMENEQPPVEAQNFVPLQNLTTKIKELDLSKDLEEIEIALNPILREMEKRGISVDPEQFKKISVEIRKEINELEKEIWKLTDSEFNIASPKQLSEILFDKLNISSKGLKKTPGGVISTKETELFKLKTEHPVIELVMRHRELSKLKNTYADSLPKEINPKTGRIHTTYDQAGTVTGRLSSENPNLQTLPAHGDWAKKIRSGFIAGEGKKFLSLDYSQVELRITASLSQDKKMLSAFKQGLDIHTLTAGEINNVPLDKVSNEMRRNAKTLNFGILYGMGSRAFAQSADISIAEAKKFIDEYHHDFVGIKTWQEKILKTVHKTGKIENLLGRKRLLPDATSSNPKYRTMAERMAINFPIQSLAADIIKIAMVRVDKFLKDNKLEDKIQLLLQIHDELIFEVEDDFVQRAEKEISQIMENALQLEGVDLKVDSEVGKSLGELK